MMAMAKGIYIASKSKHGPRWQALRASGVPIISTWIDEAGEGETSDWPGLWDRCLSEAASATVLIMYVEPGETHKGSLVELGATLAAGAPVLWVGPEVGSVRRHRAVTVCQTVESAVAIAMSLIERTAQASSDGRMTLERAHEINSALVRSAGSILLGPEYVPLPKGVSLEEMCVATRMLDEAPEEERQNPDGSRSFTLTVRCDPRIIAAMYAFDNFEQNPYRLLEALGFRPKERG
jgi:hypothetical protein